MCFQNKLLNESLSHTKGYIFKQYYCKYFAINQTVSHVLGKQVAWKILNTLFNSMTFI